MKGSGSVIGSELYNFSYDYLKKMARDTMSIQQIDDFLNNADIKPNWEKWEDVFELLANILQDFQMYSNVIKFNERKNDIKDILHDYDINYISQLNEDDLVNIFKFRFKFEKETLWRRYSRSLIDLAKFFSSFKDINEFRNVCDAMNISYVSREAFALFLSKKIYNMGFAIACNILKELGYLEYIKLDVHMIDICRKLFTNNFENIKINSEEEKILTFEIMTEIANDANVSPYNLDKVWWLICSGNFYRYDVKIPSHKVDFINSAKKEFGI
ncbi:MAG: hypothetical protein ACTTIR_07875 [Eggerthia catenaformis]|uniref:hypothetical protein n=1 Tax=Eggerthia catenaformis TaxID=31973 RepID=UPI003F9FCB96